MLQALNPPQPLSTQLIITIPQIWYGGNGTDPATYQGCPVQVDTINEFLDHGTHSDITSPVVQIAQSRVHMGPMKSAGETAISHPSALQNVVSLADKSSIIVKGLVLARKEQPDSLTPLSHKVTLTVQIVGTLKGDETAGAISVEYVQEPRASARSLRVGEYDLLFLNKTSEGTYALVDSLNGALRISGNTKDIGNASHSVTDRLEAELFASLSDYDRDISLTALEQIGNLPEVQSLVVLREISQSDDPERRGLAYAALIKLGDYESLPQAITFAEAQVPKGEHGIFAGAEKMGSIAYAIDSIGDKQIREARRLTGDPDAVCPTTEGVPLDKAAVSALHSVLSSDSVYLRRSSVYALRGICDPASAGTFAHALNDADLDVAYNAMMGLAALEDYPEDLPAPDTAHFNANPRKYVSAWQQWWDTIGKVKYAQEF